MVTHWTGLLVRYEEINPSQQQQQPQQGFISGRPSHVMGLLFPAVQLLYVDNDNHEPIHCNIPLVVIMWAAVDSLESRVSIPNMWAAYVHKSDRLSSDLGPPRTQIYRWHVEDPMNVFQGTRKEKYSFSHYYSFISPIHNNRSHLANIWLKSIVDFCFHYDLLL